MRVAARESCEQRARELHPEIADKNPQQMQAYREMPDEELFRSQWVRVTFGPEDFPATKAERALCAECGEGINFRREVVRDGRTLCKACAGERYLRPRVMCDITSPIAIRGGTEALMRHVDARCTTASSASRFARRTSARETCCDLVRRIWHCPIRMARAFW